MSEKRWSPEPWRLSGLNYPLDARSGVIANWDASAEDARRIVASVNACAGIPTEALESGVLAEALDALKRISDLSSDPVAAVDAVSALQRLGRLP